MPVKFSKTQFLCADGRRVTPTVNSVSVSTVRRHLFTAVRRRYHGEEPARTVLRREQFLHHGHEPHGQEPLSLGRRREGGGAGMQASPSNSRSRIALIALAVTLPTLLIWASLTGDKDVLPGHDRRVGRPAAQPRGHEKTVEPRAVRFRLWLRLRLNHEHLVRHRIYSTYHLGNRPHRLRHGAVVRHRPCRIHRDLPAAARQAVGQAAEPYQDQIRAYGGKRREKPYGRISYALRYLIFA